MHTPFDPQRNIQFDQDHMMETFHIPTPEAIHTKILERAANIKWETDPTGRDAHAKGAKLDAGKIRPALVLGGFARALWAVSAVGTYGAVKYTDDGWISVPNGQERYDDAGMRHWLKDKMGEEVDEDTNLAHAAHDAWNALARLDLMIRAKEVK